MTEHMTPLERWKELAIIENARMKRRRIGRDDMHAFSMIANSFQRCSGVMCSVTAAAPASRRAP